MKIPRIDREHLAQKPIHSRRNEIDVLIQRFCSTDYDRLWLSMARRPGGVIRISPGQLIPTLQIIGVGNTPTFVGPMQKMRQGHRVVASQTHYGKGPLAAEQIALSPNIMIDLVSDPELMISAIVTSRARQHGDQMGLFRPFADHALACRCAAYWRLLRRVWGQGRRGRGAMHVADP